MCGITGVLQLDRKPVSARVVDQMTTAHTHRGPDGQGTWCGEAIGLGHTRLAVISPGPEGQQPMLTRDGRYVLVYNGELYNYRELRAELRAQGRRFETETDTEVVLQAFAQWGAACVERFNGMFAFAAWDTVERTLVLARDRYGIKPLYYAHRGTTLLFGSEIKSMLAHPALDVRVSAPALHEYFTFQNIFSDLTLFEDVRLLPPGHVLRVPVGAGALPAPVKYWDFDFTADPNLVGMEAREAVADCFERAVDRQLVSDVDIGTYLSGGIDSGSIACVASKAIPNLRSFTCGFDLSSASGLELSCDERGAAERLSNLFKTEHYETVLKAGDMERVMQPLIWHLEDLRVGQSYPNFYAARLSSLFVKVVLSGTGGDELFAGYPWRYYAAARDNAQVDDYLDKYYGYWQRLISDEVKPTFFRKSLYRGALDGHSTKDVFKAVHGDALAGAHRTEDYVNFSLYFELKTFLHGLLMVEDKLHMAHGVESRVPFLDNDLVELATRIPVTEKLRHLHAPMRIDENAIGRKPENYFRRTNDGKLILRHVLSRYVPEDLAFAPKQGFSAPDGSWFKGESVEYLRDLFFGPNVRLFDYLEPTTVRGLLEEHFSGAANRRLLIWSFLSFEWWLRTFDPVA